jgi:sulfur carrier protein
VKVLLRNPKREIDLSGPRTVDALLGALDLNREAHLVIRNGTLVPGDERLHDDDEVEVRPVISGGAIPSGGPGAAGPDLARAGLCHGAFAPAPPGGDG